MASRFMQEKKLKMKKAAQPHARQRFSKDTVKASKPSDGSKVSPLPRAMGFVVRGYNRRNGSIMNNEARVALGVHLERREEFFRSISDV